MGRPHAGRLACHADEPGSRIKMLDKEHVAKLLDVPNGGHIGVWVTEPDGTTVVQLGVRPLLPTRSRPSTQPASCLA